MSDVGSGFGLHGAADSKTVDQQSDVFRLGYGGVYFGCPPRLGE